MKPVLRGRADAVGHVLAVLKKVARTGQGAVVFVRGEPGIGKTALLDTLVGQASGQGFTISRAKAEELQQIAPMAPLLAALRFGSRPLLSAEAFADLAPLYRQQLWLVDRLAGMLEEHAMRSPLLVAVDDVQWADRLSVFALRTLPVRLAGVPVVWILSSRTDPGGTADELQDVVRGSVPVEAVELGPLTASDVALVARDRLGVAPDERLLRLLEGANGVPYLAVELIDAIARNAGDAPAGAASADQGLPASLPGSLPGSFVAGLRGRLNALPEDVRRFLSVGAVLGQSFRVEDAAALLGGASTEDLIQRLEQAVRAGVLDAGQERVAFRHDLVRQAVYADVPRPIRTLLHRDAAELLLSAGGDPVEAAPHLLASAVKNDRGAVDILRRAAAAVRTLAPATAADLVVAAFALLSRGDTVWPRVGEDAVTLLGKAHRPREAMELGEDILETLPGHDDIGRIQGRLAWVLWGLARPDEMRERIETALELDGLSAETHRRLLGLQALALSHGDDMVRAAQVGERALKEGADGADETAEALARRALAEIALNDGHVRTALGHFAALRSAGRSLDLDEIVAQLFVDAYESARRLILLSRRSADDEGVSSQIPDLLFAQALYDFRLGRLDEADAGLVALSELGDGLEHYAQRAGKVIMARIALHRGDVRAARAYCGAVSWDTTDPRTQPRQVIMWARLLTAEGNPEGAVDLLLRHRVLDHPRAGFRWAERAAGIPDWVMDVTDAAAASGRHDIAVRAARLARRYAENNPDVVSFRGLAEQAEGMATDNIDLLRQGLASLRSHPRRLLEAGAAERVGQALLRHGDRTEAAELLDSAWNTFQDLGASGDARRIQYTMQAAGFRRRQWNSASARPVSGWQALTTMERRVARLVGEGRSNRSAATELTLSPNTVAAHLRAIFRKLEVSSRVQLVHKLMEEDRRPD
ncbi:ATP-binding protein [Streptomyces sp. NPDC087420]|uniref:ATP-binding protein n=1 Tax=Streptomyces sp. NPDC087420 TaxID=3365785 RepID=UPI0038333AEA